MHSSGAPILWVLIGTLDVFWGEVFWGAHVALLASPRDITSGLPPVERVLYFGQCLCCSKWSEFLTLWSFFRVSSSRKLVLLIDTLSLCHHRTPSICKAHHLSTAIVPTEPNSILHLDFYPRFHPSLVAQPPFLSSGWAALDLCLPVALLSGTSSPHSFNLLLKVCFCFTGQLFLFQTFTMFTLLAHFLERTSAFVCLWPGLYCIVKS